MTDDRDPLDRLADAADDIGNRAYYEQQNRRGLLWVHATIGTLAGVQMFLWGSATTIESAIGIWARVVLASLGTVGGLFLADGLRRRPRSIPRETAGLVLIATWDLAMTLGLAIARFRQGDYRPISITTALDPGYVVAYPTTIYGGLFVMICIHLSTLGRIKRREKRP